MLEVFNKQRGKQKNIDESQKIETLIIHQCTLYHIETTNSCNYLDLCDLLWFSDTNKNLFFCSFVLVSVFSNYRMSKVNSEESSSNQKLLKEVETIGEALYVNKKPKSSASGPKSTSTKLLAEKEEEVLLELGHLRLI